MRFFPKPISVALGGKNKVGCIVAKGVLDAALQAGYRNCINVSLNNYNKRHDSLFWFISFHDGSFWIATASTVTPNDIVDVSQSLGLALEALRNLEKNPVSVSPDPELTLPTGIFFEDPNPRKDVFKITADKAPPRSPKYGGRVARSHP